MGFLHSRVRRCVFFTDGLLLLSYSRASRVGVTMRYGVTAISKMVGPIMIAIGVTIQYLHNGAITESHTICS